MTRRTRVWLIVASLFTVINVGGAIYAFGLNERPHGLLHVALSLVGAWWIWRLAARVRPEVQSLPDEDRRLRELQHSVDAIAVEVERIGEAQRFTAKQAAEQTKKQPPDAGR